MTNDIIFQYHNGDLHSSDGQIKRLSDYGGVNLEVHSIQKRLIQCP